ncbi:MAG: hypothetical protein KA054_00815 [Candidatus Moranbacteria bacterium]|nr:hypothetical protein [Candidatus Moranbacteria bacterium]
MRSLWDIIDKVREKPESIRRRYMFVYVSMTMILVVGIWFISVQESFRSVGATDTVDDMKNQAAQILPSPSGATSLSELLEKGEKLEAVGEPLPMEDLFESEIRTKNQRRSGEIKAMDEAQ